MSAIRSMTAAAVLSAVLLAGCGGTASNSGSGKTSNLHGVPAVDLSYVFEPDVPQPDAAKVQAEPGRDPAVQNDFDTNRPDEMLSRTITSPDKRSVFAVYRKMNDDVVDPTGQEYRIDAYTADGKLVKKVTPDAMAVYYPDTIVFSPDSTSLAFVAKHRAISVEAAGTPLPAVPAPNAEGETDANSIATPTPTATPAAIQGVLTFASEQIYICTAAGEGLRPLTQNEGMVYFYYAWSPDSQMLAALATTKYEWTFQRDLAEQKGEELVPFGRPRVIEKNGRERRLDDNPTAAKPVWSPDSTKVAIGLVNQIRIYDAGGNNPTQAAIPLRTQLLLTSAAYDRDMRQKLEMGDNSAADANGNSANANASPTPAPTPIDTNVSTLPDERSLVSYNPISEVLWTQDDTIYFMTAFVKRMKNAADSRTSYVRWHRLLLYSGSPAAANAAK